MSTAHVKHRIAKLRLRITSFPTASTPIDLINPFGRARSNIMRVEAQSRPGDTLHIEVDGQAIVAYWDWRCRYVVEGSPTTRLKSAAVYRVAQ